MALSYKNDNDQDERANPYGDSARDLYSREQDSYDSAFNDTSDDTQENENIANAKQREESGSGWKDNFSSKDSGKKEKFNLKDGLKKKGPIGLLIAIFFGGGLGLAGFFGGPGLLVVNLAETLTDKFNYQLGSMNVRTNKVLESKISGSTKGLCTSKVSIRCKFSTMSERQFKKFERAGIAVEYDSRTSVRNRVKPTGFTYNGQSISPSQFRSVMRQDPAFRSAVHKAYTPKFAGFADRIFGKVAAKLKLSKKAPFADAKTNDDRFKSIKQQTAGGQDGDMKKVKQGDKKPGCDGDDCGYTKDEADKHNQMADEVNKGDADGEKQGKKALSTNRSLLSAPLNSIRVTGALDTTCMAFSTMQAVSNGAKMIRAAQMARYAMIFLSTASMIKAGDAQPDDVSYLGETLTKTTQDNPKSATDSFGYRYAAFNDNGKMSESGMFFMAGGGFGGELAGVTAAIMSFFPGGRDSANKTCGIVTNPFVQVGSLLAGIALSVFSGGGYNLANIAVTGSIAAVLSVAMMVLPGMLADIIAGNLIDENTFGEASGDAITAGAGHLMSQTAGAGGNAPLKPDQAVAYENLHQSVIAQYQAEERLDRHPLDPTSNATFMGKLVTKLMPYQSQLSSVGGFMNASMSIVGSSLSNIVSPYSKAASAEDYTKCNDIDYRAVNAATDPFCNPIRGIPPQYLNSSPEEILDRLGDEVDEETGEPTSEEYKDFIEQCIDRERPIGSGDENFRDDGSDCFIEGADSRKRADYYIYYMDLRILEGMDEGVSMGDAAAPEGNQDGGSSGNGLVSGETQELAKQIMAHDNVTGDSRYMAQIKAVSQGDNSCNINPTILQLVATMMENYKMTISSLNRFCTKVLTGSGPGSYHYRAGGGHAIDFNWINGVHSTGNTSEDIKFLNDVLPMLPKGSGIGQSNCRSGGRLSLPDGITQFRDSCNHIHIQVPVH